MLKHWLQMIQLCSVNNVSALKEKFNSNIENLNDWLQTDIWKLNIDKTCYIIFNSFLETVMNWLNLRVEM